MTARWTRDSVKRVLDTRRRIERLQWAARAEVIREQLRVQRGQVWS